MAETATDKMRERMPGASEPNGPEKPPERDKDDDGNEDKGVGGPATDVVAIKTNEEQAAAAAEPYVQGVVQLYQKAAVTEALDEAAKKKGEEDAKLLTEAAKKGEEAAKKGLAEAANSIGEDKKPKKAAAGANDAAKRK